jgi:glycolate oxidase FAD binding subunit
MRIGDLNRVLAEGGQEWPSDAPEDATVGGVIASGASSVRRLKVGALRDTVLETELVTGDGRLVRSGARTVKNVTGYDLHKLVVGSLGTLVVIVQVALKVRPLPRTRRTLRFDGGLEMAQRGLEATPGAASILVSPSVFDLRLEGWPAEIEEQTAAATASLGGSVDATEDATFPTERPWQDRPIVAEVAVPSSRLDLAASGDAWGALTGVGLAWVGLEGQDELEALRERVRHAGGIAPTVSGPGGLGDEPVPAPDVQRRLQDAFDPNRVLAPGRGWMPLDVIPS